MQPEKSEKKILSLLRKKNAGKGTCGRGRENNGLVEWVGIFEVGE
jgi:hypothetical protein